MLTKPGWILPQPEPLESVRLSWQENPPLRDQLPASRQRARGLMPRRNDGVRCESYSDALSQLGGMSHLYNGWVYRPTEIEAAPDGLQISFTSGSYFDHLDTTEVLAYEAATKDLAGKGSIGGAYRRYLTDPFDLARRATCLGTITLTVRSSADGCGFYMHQRDSSRLIVAPDVIHVIPAGEFTPADVGLDSRETDFDLWYTIMREYAEEFLDVEEAYGRGGRPLDYEQDWPFSELVAARLEGKLRLHVLGVGLDPLTWKPELLMVCVIDSTTFDELFASMVPQGKEGTIVVGPNGRGIPFSRATVSKYADNPNTRSAARACLMLTWRHRAALGLAVSPEKN